jgi:hypothetical protein
MHDFRIRAFLIVITTALFAAACAMLGPQSNSGTNSQPPTGGEGSSSIIKSPGSDPKGELETVAKNFLSVGSFRCRSTSSITFQGIRAEPVRLDVDYVKPDRYRIKYGIDPERIVIGKVVYVKKDEKWTKTGDDSESQIPGVRDGFSDEAMRLIDNVEYLGEESQNGGALLQYSIFGKSIGYEHLPYESKLWVFKQTGLPEKLAIDYHSANSSIIQIEYSYPSDIKIEAPISK